MPDFMTNYPRQLGFIFRRTDQSNIHIEIPARYCESIHNFGVHNLKMVCDVLSLGVVCKVLSKLVDVRGHNRI